MVDTADGFEIAERDLELRGAGDFFGTRQAGVPTFRLIDLVRDRELLDSAQREADKWFSTTLPAPAAIGDLLRSWSTRFKLMDVG
jgi:ATP-dependent DNA helicase RecG